VTPETETFATTRCLPIVQATPWCWPHRTRCTGRR
jgi:hypothetical protein